VLSPTTYTIRLATHEDPALRRIAELDSQRPPTRTRRRSPPASAPPAWAPC